MKEREGRKEKELSPWFLVFLRLFYGPKERTGIEKEWIRKERKHWKKDHCDCIHRIHEETDVMDIIYRIS